MRLASLSIVALLAPGCVSARWTVADRRPLQTVVVRPAEVAGDADPVLVAQRRAALIDSLRARGYDAVDGGEDTNGLPYLKLAIDGKRLTDDQLHAPDDARHHIYNDLHYQFVVYKVALTVVAADGKLVARGQAEADSDPAPAMRALALKLFEDVPPSAPRHAVAAR
jgi:hypothetical protein